jgi:ketosteroid isomerase-like protein
MSENVELARQAYDAYNREGITGILGFLDPEIEWRNPTDSPIAGVLVGHEGVKEWDRLAHEAFEELQFEPERITELPGGRVLAVLRGHLRGQGSEIDVEFPFAHLITFRDGKATTLRMFTSESAALEAASLGK